MSDDLVKYVKNLLKNTGAQENEVDALFGLYAWNYYKSVLEVLLPLKSKDPQFFTGLNQVFDEAVASLNEVDQNVYRQTIEEQKAEILKNILGPLLEKLPAETAKVVKINLERLA